ncbi:MAG TPA: hypothetical protein VHM48_07460, partial [Candidatus Limnocylindrales bacterium]|nr:hypothetical protein [Candidatus Limnocylindrales bacterium]
LLPSLREYAARYGLTRDRLALARPDALVMHPGPMNEGVEIAAGRRVNEPGARDLEVGHDRADRGSGSDRHGRAVPASR